MGVWIFNRIENDEDRSPRPLLKNAPFRSHTQNFCTPAVTEFYNNKVTIGSYIAAYEASQG